MSGSVVPDALSSEGRWTFVQFSTRHPRTNMQCGGPRQTALITQPGRGVWMKRRPFFIIIAATALQGCAGAGGSSTSDIVSALTGQLGVTPQQATGGVGSMLSYAKSQLSPADFGTVTSMAPAPRALESTAAV